MQLKIGAKGAAAAGVSLVEKKGGEYAWSATMQLVGRREENMLDMLACLFAAWSGLVKQTACSWDEGRREEKSRDCGGPSILVARAEQNAPAVRPGGEPWASPSSCGRKQVRSWRRNLHLLDSSYHRRGPTWWHTSAAYEATTEWSPRRSSTRGITKETRLFTWQCREQISRHCSAFYWLGRKSIWISPTGTGTPRLILFSWAEKWTRLSPGRRGTSFLIWLSWADNVHSDICRYLRRTCPSYSCLRFMKDLLLWKSLVYKTNTKVWFSTFNNYIIG